RRGHHIVHRCTCDALDVDTAVFEVPVVLDGDRRVLHVLGDLVERNLDAVLPVELRDLGTVGGKHRRLLAEILDLQGGGKRIEDLNRTVRTGCGYADSGDGQTGGDDPRHRADGGDDPRHRADGHELHERAHFGRCGI